MLTRDVVPISVIDLLAVVALVIIAGGLIYRYISWRRVAPPGYLSDIRQVLGAGTLLGTFFSELLRKVMANQGVFNESSRRIVHLMIFWGFVGLLVTTTWAYIVNPKGDYVPITHPYRILGNVSGALLLIGSTIALARIAVSERFRRETRFGDIWFLSSMWIATLTGFTTQYYREIAFANPQSEGLAALLSVNYIIHLVAIAALIGTAPFSSFIHAITTPALRYYERLGSIMVSKMPQKISLRTYKERADTSYIEMMYSKSGQVPERYDKQQLESAVDFSRFEKQVKSIQEEEEALAKPDVDFIDRVYREKSKKPE